MKKLKKYNYWKETEKLAKQLVPIFFTDEEPQGDYQADEERCYEFVKQYFAEHEYYALALYHIKGNEELMEEQGYVNEQEFADNPVALSVVMHWHCLDNTPAFGNAFNKQFEKRFPKQYREYFNQ